jgi:hypothetical protein
MGNWKKSFWLPALFLTGAELWIAKLNGWPIVFIKAVMVYPSYFAMSIRLFPVGLGQYAVAILMGAGGGLWSWLAGGRLSQRLLTGLSPWFLNAAGFVEALAVVGANDAAWHYGFLGMFWRSTLRMCGCLVLGTFPFLVLKARQPETATRP